MALLNSLLLREQSPPATSSDFVFKEEDVVCPRVTGSTVNATRDIKLYTENIKLMLSFN